MKIAICSSIEFTPKIKIVAEELRSQGHEVEVPLNTQKIIEGEMSFEDYKKTKKEKGDQIFREQAGVDLIKRYYKKIKEFDAILVINETKKGIDGYIGGNTLLEMGFAYVLEKKIFLLNNIPEMSYTDEIIAMKPIVLKGKLGGIKK